MTGSTGRFLASGNACDGGGRRCTRRRVDPAGPQQFLGLWAFYAAWRLACSEVRSNFESRVAAQGGTPIQTPRGAADAAADAARVLHAALLAAATTFSAPANRRGGRPPTVTPEPSPVDPGGPYANQRQEPPAVAQPSSLASTIEQSPTAPKRNFRTSPSAARSTAHPHQQSLRYLRYARDPQNPALEPHWDATEYCRQSLA